MLTYYPVCEFYTVFTFSGSLYVIGYESHAFEFCEYLRKSFGTIETQDDLDRICFRVLCPEQRVEEIKQFVFLERHFKAIMKDGE